MSKIILTGAQGTGKTTVLNTINHTNKITEVVRKLNREKGIKINEAGDGEGQRIIFDTYLELLDQDDFVSDRGLTDVIAYSLYLSKHNKIDRYLVMNQIREFERFIEQHPDIEYFFFPIEFDVVDDGVRSTSEEFRYEISRYIKALLKMVPTQHVFTVHGTPEERLAIINEKCKM